ncbi:MAG: hypothetical protein U5N56_04285 [Candidatus Marinimicrobia bacterium]|nr:hypothetical protein [Candidatus Neomarinimicrobiota bacterium]
MEYILFMSGIILGAVIIFLVFLFLRKKDKDLLEEQRIRNAEIQEQLIRFENGKPHAERKNTRE